MRKHAVIFALILCAAAAAAPAVQNEEPVVKVSVVPPAASLEPGRTAVLALELTIRPPYHINSDQPADDFLIGTTVEFKARSGVKFGRVGFPPALLKRLPLSDKPLSIFEGTVRITAEITLAPEYAAKTVTVEGTIGYQACDEQSCQPPADAAFEKEISVAAKTNAPPVENKRAPALPETKNEAGKTAAGKVPAQDVLKTAPAGIEHATKSAAGGIDFGNKSLFVTFLLVFLGGLALNLTPCIYPLIPITISYFGGQAGGKKGGAVVHAVVYIVGMAVTYSILGVLAAFTGSLFGAALTYPPVLVAIALVMIGLALSMFDVYEFRMPAFLNKAAGSSRKGFFGTFFMGLTVGIIAAPCIGPFVLGLLTYVGNRGNVLLGFTLFFVLALGLGVPFLILGVFSGSITKIPRSGAWMVWVRKIFGFILIAMAVYFLKTLFPGPLSYNLTLAATLFLAGIYMAWIEGTTSKGKVFPFIRNVIGAVFFVLAVITAVSGIQSSIEERTTEMLKSVAAAGGQVTLNTVDWQPYSEEALAAGLKTGKPVFIDSTADWCIACHELDAKTYSRPAVIAESRKFVMLRADLTRNNDEKVKAFYRKFAAKGCPTLIFLKPSGEEIADLRGVGFEPEDSFLAKMKRAEKESGLR